mmetsp:Transcript_10456/g.28600  ORF Transcript_10456/g.28600 Transcript_10456/m.28600 type:complete len:289 (+) Transcript_10456:732-1598(+)
MVVVVMAHRGMLSSPGSRCPLLQQQQRHRRMAMQGVLPRGWTRIGHPPSHAWTKTGHRPLQRPFLRLPSRLLNPASGLRELRQERALQARRQTPSSSTASSSTPCMHLLLHPWYPPHMPHTTSPGSITSSSTNSGSSSYSSTSHTSCPPPHRTTRPLPCCPTTSTTTCSSSPPCSQSLSRILHSRATMLLRMIQRASCSTSIIATRVPACPCSCQMPPNSCTRMPASAQASAGRGSAPPTPPPAWRAWARTRSPCKICRCSSTLLPPAQAPCWSALGWEQVAVPTGIS